MANLLEALMILCFGLSWPLSVHKAYKSRTAQGKSLSFELFIWIGYVFGIARKIIQINAGEGAGVMFYMAFIFYVFNIAMISVDILLYFRNRRLDRERGLV